MCSATFIKYVELHRFYFSCFVPRYPSDSEEPGPHFIYFYFIFQQLGSLFYVSFHSVNMEANFYFTDLFQ